MITLHGFLHQVIIGLDTYLGKKTNVSMVMILIVVCTLDVKWIPLEGNHRFSCQGAIDSGIDKHLNGFGLIYQ